MVRVPGARNLFGRTRADYAGSSRKWAWPVCAEFSAAELRNRPEGGAGLAQQPAAAAIIQAGMHCIQQHIRIEAKAVVRSKRGLLEVSTATCFYMSRTWHRFRDYLRVAGVSSSLSLHASV